MRRQGMQELLVRSRAASAAQRMMQGLQRLREAEVCVWITATVQQRGGGRRRGCSCLPGAARSNLLNREARRQRLLQLVRLVRVHDAQRVQVLAAANLELGRARRLLDLDGCGGEGRKGRSAPRVQPGARAQAAAPNPRVAARALRAWRCTRRSRQTHASRAGGAPNACGHAQRASFRRAVSRKSLISMISFG